MKKTMFWLVVALFTAFLVSQAALPVQAAQARPVGVNRLAQAAAQGSTGVVSAR